MNILKFGYSPWRYPSNWFRNIRQFFRNIKYAYQRITRGYADADTWNFDNYLSKIIANGTRHLANTTHSYPVQLQSGREINEPEVWTEYLLEMANYFEMANKLEWDFTKNDEQVEEALRKGMEMLQEAYFHLWD